MGNKELSMLGSPPEVAWKDTGNILTMQRKVKVSEAVGIGRTGAERILNSKGVYSRCSLPRIVPVDTSDDDNLGDKPSLMGEEVVETNWGELVQVYREEETEIATQGLT